MLGLRAQIHQLLLELGTRLEMPKGIENPRLDHWSGFARDARRAQSLSEANLILQRHIESLGHGRFASIATTPKIRTNGKFTPIPPSYQLDEAFCVYLRRRVGDDGTFRVDGETYRVSRGLGRRGWVGMELGIRVNPGLSIAAFYQGELIEEYPLAAQRPADLGLLKMASR
jgi:hypothetical protein